MGGGLANAIDGLRHVFLRDMVLPARIGVYPHERTHAQRVRVNIDLAVAEDPAPPPAQPMTVAEELARVVDYEQLAIRVRAIVGERHVRLVETLAEALARACLLDPRVRVARVRVEKLDVFPDAVSAGVEIERRQRDLSTTAGNG
jgi:dihydroneopterin aldolase